MDTGAIIFFSVIGGIFLLAIVIAFITENFEAWKNTYDAAQNAKQEEQARWHARSDVTEQGIYELKIVLERPDGRPIKAFGHGQYETNDPDFIYRRSMLWSEAQTVAADLNSELDNRSTG